MNKKSRLRAKKPPIAEPSRQLSPEQIHFAAVLGAALAEFWDAQQATANSSDGIPQVDVRPQAESTVGRTVGREKGSSP